MAIGRVYLPAPSAARADDRGRDARAGVLERALGGTAPRSEGLALYGRALYLSRPPRGRRTDSSRGRVDLAGRPRSVRVSRRCGRKPASRPGRARRAHESRRAAGRYWRRPRPAHAGRSASASCRCAPATRLPPFGTRARSRRRSAIAGHARVFSRMRDGSPATRRAPGAADRALAASPRDPALQRLTQIIR